MLAWMPHSSPSPMNDSESKALVMENQLGPRPHALYADRDRYGNPRIAITLPRKGQRGGRRLKTLTGHLRNIAYPYLSQILFDHTGHRLDFESSSLRSEYHPISEDTAVQMLLLMEAVRSEPEYTKARSLAEAIAAMNHCEAAWWFAHHRNRCRPRRVIQALELMHG